MRRLAPILRLFAAARGPLLLGLALALAAVAAGAALLGLAGWFIAASAAAGVAGAGLTFDFFRPSAAIRFLALARAASRYGERLASHDATLRLLAALRARLFRALAARPLPALARLRRAVALNRIIADVDALDGLWLRILAPAATGAAAVALGVAAQAVLVGGAVAVWTAVTLAVAAAAAVWAARRGAAAARRRALALEALRVRVADLADGAVDLAMAGRLAEQQEAVARADAAACVAGRQLDRLDRQAGAGIDIATAAAAGGALALAAAAGAPSEIGALGVFLALGLAETVAPLRRGALEWGRIALAARRVGPALSATPESALTAPVESGPPLVLDRVCARRPDADAFILEGLSLTLEAGAWVALTGPSGCGKSTALALAAGAMAPDGGAVRVFGAPPFAWPEAALRNRVAMLPQRAELFAGTVAENLRLAAPDAPDDALWTALAAVALDDVLAPMGGLAARLGESGAGLSGGEARRLALARIVLRRPALALLDEPTEGLDGPTAVRVLAGLRSALGDAAVVLASHRAEETGAADRRIALARR